MNGMRRKESRENEPSGFRPINPWKSEHLTITRRNLPHFQVPGATYFVTIRCQYNITLSTDARDLVFDFVRACDGESIDLEALVVMPEHVHLIFRITRDGKLHRVLQRIKGHTARQINHIQPTSGSVWFDESFDHIIRHEAELDEQIEYVRSNPVRSGLSDKAENYRWLYVRGDTG
jgi:REP element-mobilizing transposase RayT